ncbi:MAG: hypothetical protein IPH53_05480 [Flavobacteriales bacterium]|nr:hypothetical protein [Flavobacteriales bacterium]
MRALWAGNVLRDAVLKYAGTGNDRDPVLTAIGGAVPTATLTGQYRAEDVNMDGQVKYAGSANDRDIILQNIGDLCPRRRAPSSYPDQRPNNLLHPRRLGDGAWPGSAEPAGLGSMRSQWA